MVLLNFLLTRKKTTANIAKERLQIIIAKRHTINSVIYYLPQLKRDLFDVICKYIKIDPEKFSIQVDKKDEYTSILEVNISLLKKK